MEEQRTKKFRRDGMDVRRASKSWKNVKQKLDTELNEIISETTNVDGNTTNGQLSEPQNNETISQEREDNAQGNRDVVDEPRQQPHHYTTEELTEGIDIPSREPILLTDNPKYQDASLKMLLSKCSPLDNKIEPVKRRKESST
jgi:hypothetical protein